MKMVVEKVRNLSWQKALLLGLALAVVIELVTVLLRFGFGLKAEIEAPLFAPLTFGWRIHHGYPGVLLLIIAPFLKNTFRRNLLIILGVGLLVSDLVHHLCVLWPIVGSPEFGLKYPVY